MTQTIAEEWADLIDAAHDDYVAEVVRVAGRTHLARWKALDGSCGLPWPASLADVDPLRCQLENGHTTHHRARINGMPMEWH